MKLPRIFRKGARAATRVASGDVTKDTYSKRYAGPKAINVHPLASKRHINQDLTRAVAVPNRPVIRRITILHVGPIVLKGAFPSRLAFLPTLIPIGNRGTATKRQLSEFYPRTTSDHNGDRVTIMWYFTRQSLGTRARAASGVTIRIAIVCGHVRRTRLLATNVGVGACNRERPFPPQFVNVSSFWPRRHASVPRPFRRGFFRLSPMIKRVRNYFEQDAILYKTLRANYATRFLSQRTRAIRRDPSPFKGVDLRGTHKGKGRVFLLARHCHYSNVLANFLRHFGARHLPNQGRNDRSHPFRETVQPVDREPAVKEGHLSIVPLRRRSTLNLRLSLGRQSSRAREAFHLKAFTCPLRYSNRVFLNVGMYEAR